MLNYLIKFFSFEDVVTNFENLRFKWAIVQLPGKRLSLGGTERTEVKLFSSSDETSRGEKSQSCLQEFKVPL